MRGRYGAAYIAAMLIFGTIGLVRRYIDIPSGALAMLRGIIGVAALAVIIVISGKRPDMLSVRRNLLKLILSGICIGANWMLLFEAYNHTSVAAATLCYYMAPVIVMLLSPVLLKERLSGLKIGCILAAVAGMVPVSGILTSAGAEAGNMKGILLGLGAATLYAGAIIVNKRIAGVKAMDRTVVQLSVAAVVVMPYAFGVEKFSVLDMNWISLLLVLVAGVVHTGIAYALYFGAIEKISGQTAALMSYIDPIFAVILSALVLGESMGAAGWAGAAVVIGAMMLSEPAAKKAAKNTEA